MTLQRLSKALASAGVASRRKCEELIMAGKVSVNQKTVKIPQTPVDLAKDKILVEGKEISRAETKVYFAFNKPAGLLCTSLETASSKSVLKLLPKNWRLFTVGRLDKDTKGLLLITNDGHFANAVIHPSRNVTKEYLAKTDKEITDQHLKALALGSLVEDVWVKPVAVKKVRRGTVKIVVSEGKKHEVRTLLENVGLKTLELKRIRIGSLVLGALPEGEFRHLKDQEIEELIHG